MQRLNCIIFIFILLTVAEAKMIFTINLNFEQYLEELTNKGETCKIAFGNEAVENLKEARNKLFDEFFRLRNATKYVKCNDLITIMGYGDSLQKTMIACAFDKSSPAFQELSYRLNYVKTNCPTKTFKFLALAEDATNPNTNLITTKGSSENAAPIIYPSLFLIILVAILVASPSVATSRHKK